MCTKLLPPGVCYPVVSSGNVELLDYEPEGEDLTAQQFSEAGAGDERCPTPRAFTVDDLLDNIATADPADLEDADNAGRTSLEDIAGAARLSSDSPLCVPPFSLPPEDKLILLPHIEFMAYQRLNEMWCNEMWCNGLAGKIAEAEAREQAKREGAERVAEREAALAAAARKQEEESEAALAAAPGKQEEEREAALAGAARKQEEERAAALAAARKQEEDRNAELAEREAYVQAAMATQGALRSRPDHLEFPPHGPHAEALPSPSPHRRVVAPLQLQSQRASVAKENGREVAATPEFSVTLGRPAGKGGASTAAEAAGPPVRPLHALPMFLEGTRTTVGRRLLHLLAGRTVGVTKIRRPRAGRTTTAAPPSLRKGTVPEMAGEGKPRGPSLPDLRRRAATAGAGVGAQNVNSAPILRLGVAAAGAKTGAGATAGRPAMTAVAAEKGDGSQTTETGK
ncbi:unnamed protein product [Ectocarpus sp. CCAP 1310/34]|nr:unnamed protein product [Ectocarpus sp. CCAP 1310/34]